MKGTWWIGKTLLEWLILRTGKQNSMSFSIAKIEHITTTLCYAQQLCFKYQLEDFGVMNDCVCIMFETLVLSICLKI